MIPVSAFTIVRNEEILIAKHLVALTQLVDEVVCVVQPSDDATLRIANGVARQLASLRVRVNVVSHAPTPIGKEYSLLFAVSQCQHEWCLNLDADETYAGTAPGLLVEGVEGAIEVVWIERFHAVASSTAWFKQERSMRARLFRKQALREDVRTALHRGLDEYFLGRSHISANHALIVECKATWQHYVDQLFCRAYGAASDYDRCQVKLSEIEKKLGEAFFQAYFPEAKPPV